MFSRYLVQHERESRPSLLVDVVDVIDDAAVARTKQEMYGRGCWHGLVIDSEHVVVLRDMFDGADDSSIKEEYRLDAARLLPGPGSLGRRVQVWLEAMAANWRGALPTDEWAAVLLYDVVPALAGAEIDRIESDAA